MAQVLTEGSVVEFQLETEENTMIQPSKNQSSSSSSSSINPADDDPTGPKNVLDSVNFMLNEWGHEMPNISPSEFLYRMLFSRGYSTELVPSSMMLHSREIIPSPSPKQLQDYDMVLTNAVRSSNYNAVVYMQECGRSMNACNQFSESTMHMACRRANHDVVDYMISHGGDVTIVDDSGRTPLHDACWRTKPAFDVVTLLLDKNLDLLRCTDKREALPLSFVRGEHWVHWCAYLFHQKDRYWPVVSSAAA